MAKFVLYVNGGEDGCDYTIDCNKTLVKLKATTKEAALVEAEQHLGDPMDHPGCGCGEGYAKAATLYEVASEHEVDILGWVARERTVHIQAGVLAEEAAQRAEFERLKKKFEG